MPAIQSLLAFSETAKRGSFAAASREIGSDPSTLAKSVSRLEASLGLRLFHRTTRQVRLTPDGERLFERCQRLLAEFEALQVEASGVHAEPSGVLRVDMPIVFGRKVVLPVIAGLLARHPRLHLDARFSDALADIVRDGIDVAIRVGPLQDSTLVARRIASQDMQLCAAPDYVARHGAPRRVADLAAHAPIVFRMPTSGRDRPWQLAGRRQVGDTASIGAPALQRRRCDGRGGLHGPGDRAAAELHGLRGDRRRAAGGAAARIAPAHLADPRADAGEPAGAGEGEGVVGCPGGTQVSDWRREAQAEPWLTAGRLSAGRCRQVVAGQPVVGATSAASGWVKLLLGGYEWRCHRPHPGKEARRYQVEEARERPGTTGASWIQTMSTMSFQGYTARIEYDERDDIFVGRVLGLRSIISFHGKTVAELRREFTAAVKDYLADCADQGISPEKPASGKLLIRVPPEVHSKALIKAQSLGKSLNQWATEALERAVSVDA